ncbi:MAG: hypothetical protein CMP68_04480 [Flavobacteriales bacterium]|nr:hypothetical protein [Flavobacteriales bacterium]|tara:strand:- start:16855 stop:17541 length:687 start_codon:yes stop_codon:yes gene_type:complete
MYFKKHLANILTLINLSLGLTAIFIGLISSNVILSSILILTGVLFDFLDGKVARFFQINNEYGKQLDSFADMITFGIGPSVIIFLLISEHDIYLACIAFIIPIFSALRLSKYNIDNRQGDYFIGLTTTTNAILFSSIPLIRKYSNIEIINSLIDNKYFLSLITIFFSFLLVCKIKTFSLKFNNSSKFEKKIKTSFLIISFILIIVLKFLSIPIIIFFYMLLSIIFKTK